MTTEQLTTLLGAIAVLIAAIGKFIVDIHNLKQKMQTMSENVSKIEHATNSMKDALVSAALDRGKLEGAATERRDQSQREDDKGGSSADPLHVKLTEE